MRVSAKILYLTIKFYLITLWQGKFCHIIMICGLYFAINRAEMHFLREFGYVLMRGLYDFWTKKKNLSSRFDVISSKMLRLPIFFCRFLHTEQTHETFDPWVTFRIAQLPFNSNTFESAVKRIGGVNPSVVIAYLVSIAFSQIPTKSIYSDDDAITACHIRTPDAVSFIRSHAHEKNARQKSNNDKYRNYRKVKVRFWD